jgi:hypothetical protein
VIIGDTLTFAPRGGDPARMHLPKVLPLCIDKGRVDCGDTNGTLKLWPGERLTVRCVLSDEAVIAEFLRQPLLVLTADTQAESRKLKSPRTKNQE